MVYSHSLTLPWSISAEDERRFRKVLITVLLLTIVLGVAIPLLPLVKKPIEKAIELPPRVAKLIFEKHIEPKSRPKPKPVEKPKPKPEAKKKPLPKKKTPPKVVKKVPAEKPSVDAIEQARKKASSAGLLAMQDSLADLRDRLAGAELREVAGAEEELAVDHGRGPRAAAEAVHVFVVGRVLRAPDLLPGAGVETPQPVISARSCELNLTNEGGVGGTTRLLKNIAGLWLIQECQRMWTAEGESLSYEEITQLAQVAPPFAALIDTDAGEFLVEDQPGEDAHLDDLC